MSRLSILSLSPAAILSRRTRKYHLASGPPWAGNHHVQFDGDGLSGDEFWKSASNNDLLLSLKGETPKPPNLIGWRGTTCEYGSDIRGRLQVHSVPLSSGTELHVRSHRSVGQEAIRTLGVTRKSSPSSLRAHRAFCGWLLFFRPFASECSLRGGLVFP